MGEGGRIDFHLEGGLCVAVCWRQAVGGQRTGGAWEQGCLASLRVWEGPPDSSSMDRVTVYLLGEAVLCQTPCLLLGQGLSMAAQLSTFTFSQGDLLAPSGKKESFM